MVLMPLLSRLLTRSEERFSRNAETDLVCRLLLEKKKEASLSSLGADLARHGRSEGGFGGPAVGGGPIALSRHGRDQFPAVHGPPGLGQDTGGGTQGAELFARRWRSVRRRRRRCRRWAG